MKALGYELGARLAVGGMAEVFLATAEFAGGKHRTVVIKRMLPHLSGDESFIKMFLDEATITARLDHPNIVRLVDMGRLDDQMFLALEYVPGMDLEELVLFARERGQRLSIGVAGFVVCEVLKGLHHAHTRTKSDGRPLLIVHRDVTPANILLGLDGSAKIGDFGIAKAVDRYSGTQVGVLKGNFQFMAPEQVSGEPIDHRADIYGAGMTLRVLLTGMLPFDSDSLPVLLDHVAKGDFPSLLELDPDSPPALDAIVRRATARKPGDRFPTAEAFREALASCVLECGEHTGPADFAAVLADVRRGRDDLRMLGNSAVRLERAPSDSREIPTFHARNAPPADDDFGPTHATLLPPPSPAPHTDDDGPTRATVIPPPHPAASEPAEESTPLAPTPFASAAPVRFRSAAPAPAEDAGADSTQVSAGAVLPVTTPKPAGKPLEFPGVDVTGDDVPRALPASASKAAPAPRAPVAPAKLPPGPIPVPLYQSESVRLPAHRQSVSALAFANAMTMVSAGNDQILRIWDLHKGVEVSSLRGHTGAITSVAVGAGGVIVSGSRDKTARVWRVGSSACERVLPGHAGWVFTVAISGDGLLVASGGVDKSIRLWDLGSGAQRRLMTGHTDTVSAVTFLPDGRMVSASYDQTVRLWRADGTVERVLGGQIGTVRALAASPDGICAVSAGADGLLRVWHLESGELAGTLGPHDGPVVGVAFVPGTALIASASYDGTARLWDLGKRVEIARLALEGAVTAVAPSATGHFLAFGNGDGSLALWAPR